MPKVAIIGCGPTGLAACHELLSLGHESSDLFLIDTNISEYQSVKFENTVETLTVLESFMSSSSNGAFSKPNSQNLRNEFHGHQSIVRPSNAHVWGASCLPPPNWESYAKFNFLPLMEKYKKTISRWGVQGEVDALAKHFPVSSEIQKQLVRKRVADQFSNECSKYGIVGGHSRLALSNSATNSCVYCGKCLQGCPREVPWSPSKELRSLTSEFPNLKMVNDLVRQVLIEDNHPTVILDRSGKIIFDQVFLAAGWRQTSRMMESENRYLDITGSLAQSTVVMRAFYLDEPIDDDSFFNSFSYHDSVLSIPPSSITDRGNLVQMYYPTAELAGRITSIFPHILHNSIEYILRKDYRWNINILKRIGIAMIFSEGGEWASSKSEVREIEANTIPALNGALDLIGGKLVPGVREVLDQGRSEHVGSWEPLRALSLKLINEDLIDASEIPQILPIDTMLLPFIPPGPHTAFAASLSRIAVARWNNQ
jgi:hypothetical protein